MPVIQGIPVSQKMTEAQVQSLTVELAGTLGYEHETET